MLDMQLDISTKNIELDDPLRVFVTEKIGALARPLGSEKFAVRVEIGKPSRHHRHGEVFYAEANLILGATVLRAQQSHHDLRAAIVDVRDELKIQIKKFKEKRSPVRRNPTS